MCGQLCVELELEPEDVPEELELVPPEPELDVDDGEVDVLDDPEGLEVALPELPVVVDVVAALAASAPPARSPEVSAPMASTLRRWIFMGVLPFRVVSVTGSFEPASHTLHPESVADRTTTWVDDNSLLTNG
jgi:hypothetical protein